MRENFPYRCGAKMSKYPAAPHRVLGALQVADDGMRNWSAWTTSGQSHGSMFSQDTNGSSCLSSEAPNCSLRETSLVSLLDSD